MLRTQLYDPFVDPQRLEFYSADHGTSQTINPNGYFVRLDHHSIFSIGSRLWRFYNSLLWQPIRSILCRLLMVSFICLFIIDVALEFDMYVLAINLVYVLLIVADGFVVLVLRKGLEDRWCSMSLLFFVCAGTCPLFILEIIYGSYLSIYIFRSDFNHHLESHYKQLNESAILASVDRRSKAKVSSEKFQMDSSIKETLVNRLSKYETLFCLTILICRLFLPQATLTWGAISSMCEFAFNTLFDVYNTLSMCRDPKLNLPLEIKIISVLVSNGAILSNSLNQLNDDQGPGANGNLNSTLMSKITNNFYFRLLVQIVFADLPFLGLRLYILFKWPTFIKIDIYYLIVKQLIIVTCKLVVIAHEYFKSSKNDSNFDRPGR